MSNKQIYVQEYTKGIPDIFNLGLEEVAGILLGKYNPKLHVLKRIESTFTNAKLNLLASLLCRVSWKGG